MKPLKNTVATLLLMVFCYGVPLPTPKPVVKDTVKTSKIIK
jgi:hypothetical protein